jgi:hypothetical protein
LIGLTGIQEWASKLETALRSQGNKIDQQKAKAELLPRVVAIQKQLSDLEDINRSVVEDAGTREEDLNRTKMIEDLGVFKQKIKEIQGSFNDLRRGVQVISLPEMTDVERLGEDYVQTRGLEIDKSLKILGYGEPASNAESIKVNYTDLKASSDKITKLLHQAQDAFGKLHHYLET